MDGSSKLTRIIIYFQIRGHGKLITTFFTGYFLSPSVCRKNLKFCWKLLWTIIYFLELEKLIIVFFFRKKLKKCEFVTSEIYIDIHRYIVHIYIDISNAIYQYFWYIDIPLPYRYFRYIDIPLPSLPTVQPLCPGIWTIYLSMVFVSKHSVQLVYPCTLSV